jgi:hypothetical protein
MEVITKMELESCSKIDTVKRNIGKQTLLENLILILQQKDFEMW